MFNCFNGHMKRSTEKCPFDIYGSKGIVGMFIIINISEYVNFMLSNWLPDG